MTLGFVLAYTGFFALCFTMERHQRRLRRRALPRTAAVLLRGVGFTLLSLALATCLTAGAGVGVVLWFGLLTAAALLLVVLLTYAPRLAVATAAVAVPLAAVGLLGQHLA